MNTNELQNALRGLDDRTIYAKGVADGRELKRNGASHAELIEAARAEHVPTISASAAIAASETARARRVSDLYACGLVGGYFEFRPPEEFLAQTEWYHRHSFPRDARRTKGVVYPLGTLEDYKYVVTLSFLGSEILLSRKRDRETWETQGGHIEPGETPLIAARRELYEESGALDYDIEPLCDYFGYDDVSSAGGVVFLARVRALGPIPESEMAEVRAFPVLPENLTYPGMTPVLFDFARTLAAK